jgi:NADH dehydrogenase (ubiquinone) Fe-S protein 1
MLKIHVNNIELFVKPNSTVLEACEAIGIEIPRFCYHENLSIAGNCRMCLVEVEKSPKPVVSCAMPVMQGMKIFTNTPLVKKAREGVLEFLLLNHPLDCPICDQGGECDLQDQAMLFGNDRSRFYSFKRSVEDKNVGPLIKTIMTRCIHCTRCVRFATEIAGIEDLGTTSRGTHTEIGTYIEKVFQSELSGNVIDLCPVGALTSKPYAFTSRPWELKVSESIDLTDGIGSNIRIDFKETEIMRILPRFNEEINSEWISNKTRFFFDGLKHNRLSKPYVSIKTPFFKKFQSSNWEFALSKIGSRINKISSENIVGVCGLNTDLETQITFKEFINSLGSEKFGFETVFNTNADFSSQYKFNKSLLAIQNTDLCLLIGTNPRYEGSLLNVHLRKKMLESKFKVAYIGTSLNLTYTAEHLGLGVKVLKEIFVDEKHPFINEFRNAKNPLIIIGSSILKRKDSKVIISLLNSISNKNIFSCSSYKNNTNCDSLNFLSTESNQFGALELGLLPIFNKDLRGITYHKFC